MGSRARATAAACLVASGLLAGGLTTATAFADPPGRTAPDDTSDGGADDATSPVRQVDRDTTVDDRGDRGEGEDRDIASDPDDGDAPEGGDAAAAGDESDSPSDVSPGRDLEVPLSEALEEAQPRLPWPPCCAKGEKDCWPWPWPWPEPEPDPDGPPRSDDDGGGFPDLPVGLPFPGPAVGVPPELVPPTGEPLFPDVVDTVPGVGVTVSALREGRSACPS